MQITNDLSAVMDSTGHEPSHGGGSRMTDNSSTLQGTPLEQRPSKKRKPSTSPLKDILTTSDAKVHTRNFWTESVGDGNDLKSVATCNNTGYSNFNVGTHVNTSNAEDERQVHSYISNDEEETETNSLLNECKSIRESLANVSSFNDSSSTGDECRSHSNVNQNFPTNTCMAKPNDCSQYPAHNPDPQTPKTKPNSLTRLVWPGLAQPQLTGFSIKR